MLGNLTGTHLLIVLGVLVVLFGANKLPSAARSVGQSMRVFKSEMRQSGTEETSADTSGSTKSAESSTRE